MRKIVLVAAAVAVGVASTAQTADVVKASSFGWNPTNATKCLQAALDSGARVVRVDKQVGDWIVDMQRVRSNTEVVFEDGVRVVALPGSMKSIVDNLFRIKDATNVVFRGEGKAVLQMRRDEYFDPSKYRIGSHRHTVSLHNVRNVVVRDLTVLDSGGDGIYVLDVDNALIENCVLRGHARQGSSVICANGVVIRNCVFEQTKGTLPECGMDIEPGHATFNVENVLIENCVMRSNNCSGVAVNVSSLNAANRALGVTYRNCDMYDNVQRGIWCVLGRGGQKPVKGRLLFDNCRLWNNGRGPLQVNNLGADALDVVFRNCTFDYKGAGEGAGSPIQVVNGEIKDDLNNLVFDGCRLLNAPDGVKPVAFGAMTGGGVVKGGAKGVLAVTYASGKKGTFDFGTLEKLYVPKPELRQFETGVVDFKKLVPANPDGKPAAKQRPAGYRGDFTFLQHIRTPGEYKIHFKATKVGQRQFIEIPVTVFDVNGTPHDTFIVKDPEFDYTLKAQSKNSLYRFVIKPNGCRVTVWSDTAGNGIVANDLVHWLTGGNQSIYFLAKPGQDVKVEMKMAPSEWASAELIDAQGNVVDKCVKTGAGVILRGERAKDAPAEVWQLHVTRFWDDLLMRLGAGTGGVYSYDPALLLVEQ